MGEAVVAGLDIAKWVFQAHGVDTEGRVLAAPTSRSYARYARTAG